MSMRTQKTCPKLVRPNKQNSKNVIAVTEESILVLGEPNITVKVYISLKRLLIVSSNINAIRIQSFKCSHPVNSLLVGSEACVLSINRTSTSLRKPW